MINKSLDRACSSQPAILTSGSAAINILRVCTALFWFIFPSENEIPHRAPPTVTGSEERNTAHRSRSDRALTGGWKCEINPGYRHFILPWNFTPSPPPITNRIGALHWPQGPMFLSYNRDLEAIWGQITK